MMGTLAFGCGANVVFDDPDGSGVGGGGSSTVGGSGGEGTGGSPVPTTNDAVVTITGGTCEAYGAAYDQAVTDARRCQPEDPVLQCTGSAKLPDICGCPTIVANEHEQEAIAKALELFELMDSVGCTLDCFACIPAESGHCEPRPDGSGLCVADPS